MYWGRATGKQYGQMARKRRRDNGQWNDTEARAKQAGINDGTATDEQRVGERFNGTASHGTTGRH